MDALSRVEGEGALRLRMEGARVRSAELSIYEPPRFFEAFLRGRDFREVPDITARICGICPVAYQMSSCSAIERAIGLGEIGGEIAKLRDLLYCGEWIESHVLHIFMLNLPDYLGYDSVITMARDHAEVVRRALRIKKTGNAIVTLLGGRSVHPISVCVGGFYRAMPVEEASALLPEVIACRDDMIELSLFLLRTVRFPSDERDYEFVALCPENEYPMNRGRIRSSGGLDIANEEFDMAIEETQTPHSTALRAKIRGRGAYLVGPLARLNLNYPKLHPRACRLMEEVRSVLDAQWPWRNIHWNMLARAIETVHALSVAADILGDYRWPPSVRVAARPRAGVGAHGTEAPRGVCWHRYRLEEDGTIAEARIIPPTSQNQLSIEQDLGLLAGKLHEATDADLAFRCEQMIRDYDPCISCAVHFLRLDRRWA